LVIFNTYKKLASILLVYGKTSSFSDKKKLNLPMEIIFNVTITNYSIIKKGKENGSSLVRD
jgi:hypothetical protein